jgi:hypothetical protein
MDESIRRAASDPAILTLSFLLYYVLAFSLLLEPIYRTLKSMELLITSQFYF